MAAQPDQLLHAAGLSPKRQYSTPEPASTSGDDSMMELSPAGNPLNLFVRAKRRINEIFGEIDKAARQIESFLQSK